MNRSELKRLILQGFVALLVLILPVILLFALPELVLSLWLTGLIILNFMKRQNPEVVESKRFQTFERLLYFQIISWAFAFFYLPIMTIVAPIIPVMMLILTFKKQRRENPKFIKWAKYVGFQLLNIILLFILFHFFPNIGEEGFFALSLITLFNGGTAALYLKVEHRIRRDKRLVSLLIMIIMIIVTTIARFPQYGGTTIFGG